MSLSSQLSEIQRVANGLPFGLQDYRAVGEAFAAWREGDGQAHREPCMTWLYCYCWIYFLRKATYNTDLPSTDIERLIFGAFVRVHDHFDTIEHPERFAHYTSVVCRNLFRNYLRSPARNRFLVDGSDADQLPAEVEPDALAEHDQVLLAYILSEAIAGLPEYLRSVAHMRFLEEMPYEAIEEATGLAAPILRAYTHRALGMLRENETLRDILDEWRD